MFKWIEPFIDNNIMELKLLHKLYTFDVVFNFSPGQNVLQ